MPQSASESGGVRTVNDVELGEREVNAGSERLNLFLQLAVGQRSELVEERRDVVRVHGDHYLRERQTSVKLCHHRDSNPDLSLARQARQPITPHQLTLHQNIFIKKVMGE